MDKNVIKFTVIVAIIAALAFAAQAGPASAQPVPATSTLTSIPAAKVLSYEELERRVTAQGLRISKAEVRDLLLKVTAYDSQHRKVKMVLDRRNGEVLAREISHKGD